MKFASGALCPLILAAAGNQTIALKNGNQFHGMLLNATATSITFQDDNGDRHRFDTSEVQSINFSSDGNFNTSNPNYNNNNAGYNGPRSNASDRDGFNRRNNNNNDFGNANRNPGNSNSNNSSFGNANNNTFGNAGNQANGNYRTIPSGAELSVRTNEKIDSKNASEGRTYSAEIARDVMDENGNLFVPKGSEAQLVIKSMSGGSLAGSSDLVLDVQSVMVNGQRYMVSTQDLRQSGGRDGIGRNRRTAEVVGGGTAIGTLLGAIGGGGKGALIGAIAGAAAGAGVQVLTKGREVQVPAETILNFRLDQPMQLAPVR
ncbi:MAG: hypothetical protein M3Z36_12895 [Acidobacteriota bacterium]|nr:hypothetical protein [Acidobacteriota bacterium]